MQTMRRPVDVNVPGRGGPPVEGPNSGGPASDWPGLRLPATAPLPRMSEPGPARSPAALPPSVLGIAEPASGDVAVDDLLNDLVNRVRKLMAADTAVMLLLEAGGRTLVARAASGIEAEVRQGVRVPVGSGFAGRIAAERCPIILGSVDPGTVSNPLLLARASRRCSVSL